MNLLITGGLGFVGNNILDSILYDNSNEIDISRVVIYDKVSYCSLVRREILRHDKVFFIKGDICNNTLLEQVFRLFNIDTVIHLAAESSVNRSFYNTTDYINTNILGSYNVLKLCRDYKVRKMLFMSTDEVYGESCFSDFADENAKLAPTSPYATTKASGDLLAQCFFKCFKTPVSIIRSNNIFGKYQFPEKIIPRFITLAINNKPYTMEGTGNNKRSYIFVDDLVEAFKSMLLNAKEGEIYNIPSEVEISNLEIAEKINKILNIDNKIEFVEDRIYNDPCYRIKTLHSNSFFTQKTSFDEGLRKTIQWYMDNAEKYWNRETLRQYSIIY
jgi:dTDP-glucose 4,6-dehydratase